MKYLFFMILFSVFCGCGTKPIASSPSFEPEATTPQSVARQLTKEGYRVFAGGLPLSEQLEQTWACQREKNEDGEPVYFTASGKSRGTNVSVARSQAVNIAKVQLGGLVETRIGGLVTQTMEGINRNMQLHELNSSKSLVKASLKSTVSLLEIYKDYPDGTVEVEVMMACKRMNVDEIVKKLREETNEPILNVSSAF